MAFWRALPILWPCTANIVTLHCQYCDFALPILWRGHFWPPKKRRHDAKKRAFDFSPFTIDICIYCRYCSDGGRYASTPTTSLRYVYGFDATLAAWSALRAGQHRLTRAYPQQTKKTKKEWATLASSQIERTSIRKRSIEKASTASLASAGSEDTLLKKREARRIFEKSPQLIFIGNIKKSLEARAKIF